MRSDVLSAALRLALPAFALTMIHTSAIAQAYTPTEQACYNFAQDKIALDQHGQKHWPEADLRALCKGARAAAPRGECFQRRMPSLGLRAAIQQCSQLGQPGAAPQGTPPAASPAPVPAPPKASAQAPAPAPAAGGYTPMEQACHNNVQGKIPYDRTGNTNWAEANVRALCNQARMAEPRGKCYESKMPSLGPAAALQQCSVLGLPAGTQPAAPVVANSAPPPASAPAPAAGGYTPMEQACYDNLQGKIAWNTAGNTNWAEANLRALCKGARAVKPRGACFQQNMPKIGWQAAVTQCSQLGQPGAAPQTAGAAPEPTRPPAPAPASAPVIAAAPVAASLPQGVTKMEQACYDNVQGKIAWNTAGNTNWAEANLRALCKGARAVKPRGACFQQNMPKIGWQGAVKQCSQLGQPGAAPQTAGAAPPAPQPPAKAPAPPQGPEIISNAPGPPRTITLNNHSGTVVTATATYYTTAPGSNQVQANTVSTTGPVYLGQSATLTIPRVNNQSPIVLQVVASQGNSLSPVKLNWNFNGDQCFNVGGEIFVPTIATCGGVVGDLVDTQVHQIEFKNQSGYNAQIQVQYIPPSADVNSAPQTVSSGFVNSGADVKVNIPIPTNPTWPGVKVLISSWTAAQKPVQFYQDILSSNFTGTPCYAASGTVFAPAAALCNGAVGSTVGPTRTIYFMNQAAYDSGMTVTYYDVNMANMYSPTSTTLQTGLIQTAMNRTINIPAVTMPGQPISIQLTGSATMKNSIYQATLPDNFPSNPVPCFSTSGTLFSPQGGPCPGPAANQPAVSVRSITFSNQAGYVASMTVSYTQVNPNGSTSPGSQTTGNLTAGASGSLQIPQTQAGTSISVSITGVATMNNNFFSTTVPGNFTGTTCFKAWGTLFSPQGGGC
jgi:hypothetical protein